MGSWSHTAMNMNMVLNALLAQRDELLGDSSGEEERAPKLTEVFESVALYVVTENASAELRAEALAWLKKNASSSVLRLLKEKT